MERDGTGHPSRAWECEFKMWSQPGHKFSLETYHRAQEQESPKGVWSSIGSQQARSQSLSHTPLPSARTAVSHQSGVLASGTSVSLKAYSLH